MLRIGGQAPKLRWRKNRGGLKRTIEEAVEIAKRHGVEIPEYVVFFEAEPGDLEGSIKGHFFGGRFETAIGPRVTEHGNRRVYWHDHFHRNGRVPFRIHPDILTSDEAIVAVFQHEMYELSLIEEVCVQSGDGSMDGTDYGIQTSVGLPGNSHDLAWDEADKAVLRMRSRD